MNNFISLLGTTLKMAVDKDEDEEEEENDPSRRPGINGATYVKSALPKRREDKVDYDVPVIAVEDTLTEEDSPKDSPSKHPEFSYERGTGMLNVPGT